MAKTVLLLPLPHRALPEPRGHTRRHGGTRAYQGLCRQAADFGELTLLGKLVSVWAPQTLLHCAHRLRSPGVVSS